MHSDTERYLGKILVLDSSGWTAQWGGQVWGGQSSSKGHIGKADEVPPAKTSSVEGVSLYRLANGRLRVPNGTVMSKPVGSCVSFLLGEFGQCLYV